MSDNNEYENTDEYLYRDIEGTTESISEKIFQDENNEKDEPKTNLGIISLVLLFASLIVPGLFNAMLSTIGSSMIDGAISVVDTISGCATLASFVLMIYTRIKYPKDRAAKATMWLFVAGFIIFALTMIFIIVACSSCASQLRGF